ncbi:MAG: hypothetical protein PF638_12435 [Candidatus Delongbacteria bacterium]|jgi:hypothetical protein|nr:hypothetical protein [Candidatus Delongbacteria bacterium]
MPNNHLKNVDTFFKNLVTNPYNFISTIFPGLIVSEIIFNKGLINGGINTIFDFLIFIFWIVGFSSPFLIISIISHYLDLAHRELLNNDDDDGNHQMLIPHILVLLILYVFVYKLCLLVPFSTYLTKHFYNEKYLAGVLAFAVIGLLGIPIGLLYYWMLNWIIDKVNNAKN